MEIFAEKLTKTLKGDGSSKSFKFWPNRRFFVLFDEIRHLLQLFAEKLSKTPKGDSLHRKVETFGKIDDFVWFFAK